MHPFEEYRLMETRRQFLGKAAWGMGSMALAAMLGGNASASVDSAGWRGVVNPGQVTPRIKRVIHLYMAGGAFAP